MKVKDALIKVRIIDDTRKALSKLESFLSKNKDNIAEADSLAGRADMSLSVCTALSQAITILDEVKIKLECDIDEAEIKD